MKKKITPTQVRKIIKKYHIQLDRFSINVNGTVSVAGDVKIYNRNLKKLPFYFFKVKGDFDCSSNNLISLKGVPRQIGGNFTCANNQLTSLEHGPKTVGGNYNADNNFLKNLKGIPQKLHRNLYVRGNYLENLLWCPDEIGGILFISECTKSLFMGNKSCILKELKIEHYPQNNYSFNIPQDIYYNQKHMSILLKYNSLLDLWIDNGKLNLDEFYDVLSDIMDGLR